MNARITGFQPLRRFLRLARADAGGQALITPRRIYILPTGYGLGFGLLLFLMLLGSINYANNLGFLLTFLLAALGMVSMLHTWRNLLGLELQPGRTQPVFAGQQACFSIELLNRRRWQRPGIELDIKGGAGSGADLDRESRSLLTLSLPSRRRGWLNLPRFTLSTRYPLGLFRAWVYVELDAGCLVYPAPGRPMPQSELTRYTSSQQGDKGVGADDFVGLRHYRSGDSLKQINWKALAREQGLQTKLFGGDRSERRWLEWNHLQGPREERLSQLCRGVLEACDRQLEFGLRLPGQEFKPARGQAHRHRCLQALALFGEKR